MGKISKALEKAGRETTAIPQQKKVTKHGQSNLEQAIPEVNDKTQVAAEERENEELPSSKSDEIKKTVTDNLDSHTASEDRRSQDVHQTVEDKATSAHRPDSSRKSGDKNISLVKPVKMAAPNDSYDQEYIVNPSHTASNSTRKSSERKQVKVQYSKTRVQESDPRKLMDGKVLSIFEDMETTNQFKILRTQVLRKLKAIGGNSILVTSANPCEGKTFTSINLGVSIAKEFDRTVLIIDADIRRPLKDHTDFATEFFHLQVDKGLTDYLEGEAEIEDILINPGIDKLTLIPGGLPVDNSPELLNSARMEMMIDEIKTRYPEDRLVILDGPAILRYPDAMILYRYVDGVLPVIESEKTSTEQVKKMMEYLQEVNVLGVVLNKKRG